jgi:outer membrane protein, heavy metal efflux system
MRTRTWCVAAALACLPRVVAAQTVLSEAEALARLSAESPRVRAIRSAIAIARAEALVAARWPNPRLTFNRESVAGITENMFLVTQPLPVTGRRGLEIDASSALVAASEQRADEEIRQLRAAVRRAYGDLVAAQLRETEIAASRDRMRGLAEILARREAAGEAAGYDRLRAEREVFEIEADLTTAGVDRARAQAALGALFEPSTDATTLVAANPQPLSSAPIPTVEELLTNAESKLPELLALRRDVESAEFASRAAARRSVPEPEVVAGTKSSNVSGGDVGSVLSVHFAVPLFDRARPELALAQARIAAVQSVLRAEMAALRAVAVDRRQAADRYRVSTESSARQLERIAQVSYDAGERTILELLDAYRSSEASRLRQVTLDAAVRQAEIELELVSGWETR